MKKGMLVKFGSVTAVFSLLFVAACSSAPRLPEDDVDWLGKYARLDGKYDLYLKSEHPDGDKILFATS